MENNGRTVHCPSCGSVLRRTGDVERYFKGLGIVMYGTHCDKCDIAVCIEDMSSYEQEGEITIAFT